MRSNTVHQNEYPPRSKLEMFMAKSGNSNFLLTLSVLQNVIDPAIANDESNEAVLLWDDFKGHSKKEVKDYCLENKRRAVEIMAGGITPVAQPLDMTINKIFKGKFRDKYDFYMLNAKCNDKGHPIPPSRQLLAQWVVKAWDFVSEKLVAGSWESCGYKPYEMLRSSATTTKSSAVTVFPKNKILSMVAKSYNNKDDRNDAQTYFNFFDFIVGDEEEFSSDSENEDYAKI